MKVPKFQAWIKENYYDEKPYMLHEIKAVESNGAIQIPETLHESKGWYDMYPASDIELLQYTGMMDKKGVEIYDGHIIKYSQRTINGNIFSYICQVFQHESGTWRFEGYLEGDFRYKTKGTVYQVRKTCEVIGNRYENPELMKERGNSNAQ